MWTLPMLLLALIAPAAQAAECPESVALTELSVTLDRAESAFSALDPDAFGAAMDDAGFQAPCVSEPFSGAQAARLHRLTGLRWFIVGKEADALGAFRSAAAIDNGYRFPETLVPPGHAARDVYERAAGDPGAMGYLPEPLSGTVWLDGAEASMRPTERPVVFQLLDGAAVLDTAYVLPTEPWPDYPAKDPPKSEVPGARNPIGFAIGAGGALIASGVLYGAAMGSAKSFEQDHPDYTLADLRAHRARTNGLVAGSAATFGGALVLGLTWVAVK